MYSKMVLFDCLVDMGRPWIVRLKACEHNNKKQQSKDSLSEHFEIKQKIRFSVAVYT